MKKEQLMETKKFLKYGLMISLIICSFSCNNNKDVFYIKIKDNDDCMIACEIKYNEKELITVVMEKAELVYKLKEFNQDFNDEFIIKTIKLGKPFLVPKTLYYELYSLQVIEQPRVDSLINLAGIDSFFISNKDNVRLLNPNALVNVTFMEELYSIKKLFEYNILLRRDCESGYYLEID